MKKIKIAVLALSLIALLCTTAFAQENTYDDIYIREYENSDADSLKDSLPDDARDIMRDLDLEDPDFYKAFKFSPKSILKLFFDIAGGEIKKPLKFFAKAVGILILCAVGKSLLPKSGNMDSIINAVAGSILVISTLSPIFEVISRGVTAIESSCIFMKALIPVFAGIIAMNASPALSLSYSSLTFLASQAISSLSKNTVLPLSGVFTAVSILSAVSGEVGVKELSDVLKKTAVTVLSVTAALFSAALSLKGIMAMGADNLVSRGAKLALSSAVPIVGGSLSEAYSSIIGSLNLLKSAVGMYAIIAVAVINIPVILELSFWILIFKLTFCVAQLLDDSSSGKIAESLSGTLTVINITVIFEGVLFVISSAIVLSMRNLA